MTSPRSRAILLGLAAILVLAGCAAIPTSGPVSRVPDDQGMGQSTVRYSPAPPVDGAAPGEIVRGYLDAMLAYPSSTRTAAAFLTPEAADTWQRQRGVMVYRDAQVASEPESGRADTTTVSVDSTETGRLDAEGRYAEGRGARSTGFTLVRSDGQWRISNPQAGLMVTAKFFTDYFRDFNLYYFDRTGSRLVPELVHLLVDDRLAASLITALARGQQDELEQTQTFVPELDDLRATVPVEDGVAEVGFTAGARDDADTRRLSAQVVWTLRQVPGVDAVQIAVGAGPIDPNGSVQQPISSWQEFGSADRAGTVYALRDDQVVQLDGAEVVPIEGPWGRSAEGASGVAVTDDEIALVDASRSTLRVAQRDEDGDVDLAVTGEGLIDPATDVDGLIWVIDRPDGVTRVRAITPGSQTTAVDVETTDLADLDVRSLDISPDGSRYVVTVGAGESATIRVGRILRDAEGAVTGWSAPRRIESTVPSRRSAVWSDTTRVSYLAETTAGVQVQTALIDGSTVSGRSSGGRAMLSEIDATELVLSGGPEPSGYVVDRRGRLWFQTGSGVWTLVGGDGRHASLSLDP